MGFLEIECISKETIKPLSPTPPHLRTHKLSILDQLALPDFVPIVFFYSSTTPSHHLKNSFAQALSHFYPLAGRANSASYIDCNDEGATFVEARVSTHMSFFLQQPNSNQLQQLLPCNPTANFFGHTIKELLAVQVNYFSRGGMAIGVCVNHVIADASTAATFVKCWSAIARGAIAASATIDGLIYDCTSLFPPVDTKPGFSWGNHIHEDFFLKTVTKRFVFDGPRIAELKAKIGKGPFLERPTRFEAVSALIWGAMVDATRERDVTIKTHVANVVVDLRKRMNPPLPEQCIGSICQVTSGNCTVDEFNLNPSGYNELARKIRESVKKMNDEYVREFHASGKLLSYMKNGSKEHLKKCGAVGLISFSSWCRFPFYEGDFGKGKPIWVAPALAYDKVVIFMDAPDGAGMEVWVGLSKEDMALLANNTDILHYATFTSSTT